MAALVTLQRAKNQVSIDHTRQDEFIQDKIDEATALCLRYGDKHATDPAWPWTVDTVPLEVRSAILDTFTDLYTDRGDQDRPVSRTPSPYDGFPSPSVRSKLQPWHTIPVA